MIMFIIVADFKLNFIQYTKATNAIMGIDFEITLENAKLLAKAGKKGMKVGESTLPHMPILY